MIKCLLIDDDIDDHEFFSLALQQVDKNIDFVAIQDCTDALHSLRTNTSFIPDFIFLDVNMHKMNGLECLAEIRKYLHLEKVKVIMYSTTSDEKIIEKAKQLGSAGFLVKPVSITTLINSLKEIFKNKPINAARIVQ